MSAEEVAGIPLDEILDRVQVDPHTEPFERETSFTFAQVDDRIKVHTAERGLTRRLLQHPAFGVDHLKCRLEDQRVVPIGPRALRERDLTGLVVGVAGELPIGALKVQLNPRASTSHAEVVTDRVIGQGRDELPIPDEEGEP